MKEALRRLAHAFDPVLWTRDELGFDPEPWQQDVLYSKAPRVALNCSRQAGKSTIASTLALHTGLHASPRRPALILIAAPSMRQSGELHRKVYDSVGQLKNAPKLTEDSASTIALPNGSRIVSIPASEATSRGFSNPALVIMDEASRITDEAIAAIRPMLAHGGRLVMLSTPAGQRGAFFDAYTKHRDDWQWFEVPATEIPRISPEFLEQERRALGLRTFEQEYLCRFNEGDAALFSLEMIQAMANANVRPLFGPSGTIEERSLRAQLASGGLSPIFGGR